VNINFLALDFDLTILDIHTGGRWAGSIDELVQRIRPVFAHLIREAHSAGIQIAIVTFSPQVGHIVRVIEKAFPRIHEHIVVRKKILFVVII
jgi:phosphoserine phosphatase